MYSMYYICMVSSVQCSMCILKYTGAGAGTGVGTGAGAVCSAQNSVKYSAQHSVQILKFNPDG